MVPVPQHEVALDEQAVARRAAELGVRAPHQRPIETAAALCRQHGGAVPVHRFVGMQLLGGSEVSVPGRNGPAVARVHREPGAVRIDLPEVEVGAAAVGLAPVERRGLELDGAREQAAGGGAVCDVSGVLPVVTQRREGIALGRGTVLERRGPERGLAHGGEVQQGREICGDGPLPQRRQFDPQVVRVLAVVQRGALVRLARLQEQRVPLGADGPGIGARHGAQRDPPAGSA